MSDVTPVLKRVKRTYPKMYDPDVQKNEIEKYRNAVGKPCGFHGLQSSSYTNIPIAARDYYHYWRTMLKKGTLLEYDENILELRLKEILYLNEDAFGQLDLLCRPDAKGNIPNRTALELLIDRCLLNKRPLPRIAYRDPRICGMVLSEVLASPPENLTWNIVQSCINVVGSDDDGRILDLMNRSLREYDRTLLETTGKGVLDTYFTPRTEVRDTSRQMGSIKKTGPVMVIEFMGYTGIPTFLESLYYAAYNEISNPGHRNNGDDPIWDIVHKVHIDSINPSLPDPVWGYRRITVRRFSDNTKGIPVIAKTKGEPRFGDDFHERVLSAAPSEKYVPSTDVSPETRVIGDEAVSFYRYWVESMEKGVYVDSDGGYLIAYLDDAINNDDDGTVMEKTERIFKNYQADEYLLIRNEVQAGCKLRSGQPLTLEDRHEYRNACAIITAYLQGNSDVEPSAEAYAMAVDQGYKYKMKFEEKDIWLLNRTLRMICERIHSKDKTLENVLDVAHLKEKIQIFRNLHYIGKENEQYTLDYLDFRNSDKFVNLVFNLNKTCTAIINGVPPDKTIFDRIDWCSRIIDVYNDEHRKKQAKHDAVSLVLDSSAIKDAEADLNEVTDLMVTDEGPTDTVTRPEETMTRRNIVREYLEAALKGDGKTFAKDNGLNLNKVEDEVNTAAIEAIGDNVVENGSVIEDYTEEVSAWINTLD